jgi:hypothetical protein
LLSSALESRSSIAVDVSSSLPVSMIDAVPSDTCLASNVSSAETMRTFTATSFPGGGSVRQLLGVELRHRPSIQTWIDPDGAGR